jgi:putative transposase
MRNGYRLRLYPNREQEQILLQWIGCQRLIYNAKVQEDRYFRRFHRRMVGLAGAQPPVVQQYRQFITDRSAFLRKVPSQVLRNGVVRWRQAYQRFLPETGRGPKLKTKAGRQSVWLTAELFRFIPRIQEATGAVTGYHLWVGTDKCPVGIIPYVAHRRHAVPSSFDIAVEGGRWWLSFAAEDPEVIMLGQDADAATERIAETLRHLSADPLAERTLGGDRGVAKLLATSDGQVFDLRPIQKTRSRRPDGNANAGNAGRLDGKTDRRIRRKPTRKPPGISATKSTSDTSKYAHQTSHALVVNEAYDLYVCEDLPIPQMTKRPKAKPDAQGHFLPSGRAAKAGLNRAILASAWGQVVTFTRYKALRRGKWVITVPPAQSSQECAELHVHLPGQAALPSRICLSTLRTHR